MGAPPHEVPSRRARAIGKTIGETIGNISLLVRLLAILARLLVILARLLAR